MRFPAPRAGFFLCSCKERNQRKHAPDGALFLASAALGPGAVPTRHPASRASRAPPCARPLRGARPKPYGARVRHTGFKKHLPPLHVGEMERWFFSGPRSARRVPQPVRGSSSEPLFESSRVVCGRRVGERPVGRGTEGTGEAGTRSGACFLLVPFLCTSKEKEPAVGQPPTSSC